MYLATYHESATLHNRGRDGVTRGGRADERAASGQVARRLLEPHTGSSH